MELKNPSKRQQKSKGSILQGDGNYFYKILSREASSDGHSSHKSSYRPHEGVPFKWEMQPGTPKININCAEEEIIHPPSPSPLMQSQGLPNKPPDCRGYSRPSGWLRKTLKIIQRSASKFVQTSGKKKSVPRIIGGSTRELSTPNKTLPLLPLSSS
ncbi:hypothetical protein Leryth_012802 [Lithospermum erythrorhizon]|nr:hypothetical protein Leryth_012802 [Lithospermum erythrorhizon]